MSEYHKIQSIYLRDPATKNKNFLEGQWSLPEFEYLKNNPWVWDEKVDGTNVRVYWEPAVGQVVIHGRTKDAQMPTALYAALTELFTYEKFADIYPDQEIALYGEGYGAKIQKGGGDYIPDGCGFILFDVRVGNWWLTRESVEDVAAKLGICTTPIVGEGSLLEAVEFCKLGFPSLLRKTPPEGLVLRPKVPLFTRRGDRIITKIKLKDFT